MASMLILFEGVRLECSTDDVVQQDAPAEYCVARNALLLAVVSRFTLFSL